MMKKSIAAMIAAAGCLAGAAAAQDGAPVVENPQPRFVVLHGPGRPAASAAAGTQLTTWNGSFSYSGTNYAYSMAGTNPSGGVSTTVQAVIIPLNIVVIHNRQKVSFSAAHVLANGRTVTQNTVLSPIFDSSTTYTLGSVDVGTTQYLDAFQRANFWSSVSANPGYHILLGGPTVEAVQTLSVPSNKGKEGSAFGVTVALVDINWFDAAVQTLITKFSTPNQIPIFLAYDTYLTQNGQCCIGGYHSYNGVATYMEATYVDKVGAFSQDVSALSHEVGEWVDDPYTNNTVSCGYLEVGDPEEGFANYGDFPYTVNGFQYNLQDLVFLDYFGAPKSGPVNGWLTFHDNPFGLGVCSNGG
jgi:hypothetical protein